MHVLGPEGVALDELDLLLIRGLPRGSLEQVIFRVDALHVLAAQRRALRQRPARDRAHRRQVVGERRARRRRGAHAADDRLRALRGRDAGVRAAGRRRRRQAAVRRDGLRDRARRGSRPRPPGVPRAGAGADRLLRAAHDRPRRPSRPARARRRRSDRGRDGARQRLVAGQHRAGRSPARRRRSAPPRATWRWRRPPLWRPTSPASTCSSRPTARSSSSRSTASPAGRRCSRSATRTSRLRVVGACEGLVTA